MVDFAVILITYTNQNSNRQPTLFMSSPQAVMVCCIKARCTNVTENDIFSLLSNQCKNYLTVGFLQYKVWQHNQLTYLSSMIIDYIQTPSLHLAHTDLLVIPKTRTVIASRAFRTAAPRLVTACNLQADHLTISFRHLLKSHRWPWWPFWYRCQSLSSSVAAARKVCGFDSHYVQTVF